MNVLHTPSETGTIPNIAEGFGRIDLAASIGVDPALVHEFWDEGPQLETGEQKIFTVTLPQTASVLKVTLVWTDPPGETLQNDLDLIVKTATGTVRHGNMGRTLTRFDRTNNVEQVMMTTVLPGVVTITVKAFRVAVGEQSFALVVRATA